MGNINLDDAKGYFSNLVHENLNEFWDEYTSENKLDRRKVSNTYRKMVNLCLTLNHHADKVCLKLNYTKPTDLITEIKKHYPSEGESVDVIRRFSNDIKHESKLDQSYVTRKTQDSENPGREIESPEWYYLDANGNRFSICDSAIKAFWFWQFWHDNQRPLLI